MIVAKASATLQNLFHSSYLPTIRHINLRHFCLPSCLKINSRRIEEASALVEYDRYTPSLSLLTWLALYRCIMALFAFDTTVCWQEDDQSISRLVIFLKYITSHPTPKLKIERRRRTTMRATFCNDDIRRVRVLCDDGHRVVVRFVFRRGGASRQKAPPARIQTIT